MKKCIVYGLTLFRLIAGTGYSQEKYIECEKLNKEFKEILKQEKDLEKKCDELIGRELIIEKFECLKN